MRSSPSSLRARLTLLVLLVFVPAIGLFLYTSYETRRNESTEVQKNALRMVRLTAVQHAELIKSTQQLLLALARLPEVRSGRQARCNLLFADLMQQYPAYMALAAARADGEVFCSAMPLEHPVTFGDRRWFNELMRTRNFVASEYQLGRLSGKPTMTLASPILGAHGEFQGAVLVGLNLAWLNRLATRAQLPEHSTLFVIDRNGTILARDTDAESWVGRTLPNPTLLQAIRSQGEGTIETADADGTQQVFAFAPLTESAPATAFVAIGIPLAVANEEIDRLLSRDLLGLGMVAVLTLLIAWGLGSAVILRPIASLVSFAQRLAAGDLKARSELRSPPIEFAHLARALDSMAVGLEEQLANRVHQETQLRRINQALTTVQTVALEITRELKVATVLELITSRAVDLVGADSGMLRLWDAGEQCLIPLSWAGVGQSHSWLPLRRGEGVAGAVAEQPQALIVNNFRTSPFATPNLLARTTHQAVLAQPLLYRDQLVGVLSLNRESERLPFSQDDADLLNLFAVQAAIAIENARLYEKVQDYARTLEARVKRRTRELTESQAQLVQSAKLAGIGTLASGVAHELNQPLTVIRGYAQILLMDVAQLPPDSKPILEAIDEQAKRMARVIDHLRNYARQSPGKLEPVSLNEVAEAAFTLLTRQLAVRNIDVVRCLDPDQPLVLADRFRLEQVFVNLITNARDAMADHGGGTLTVVTRVCGDHAETEFADSGPGIASEHVAKVFDPFFTTKEVGKGTGLGLSISMGIVKEHQGEIQVRSEPGAGATFIVRLTVFRPPSDVPVEVPA